MRWIAFVLLSLNAALTPVLASETVVEGSAPIRNGDVGQARELATRRALARAAESKAAQVSAQTLVHTGAVFDSVQVKASGCTENAEQLSERVSGDELTVTMRVMVREQSTCLLSCRGAYINRLLVTGFDVEYHSQLLGGEGLLSNRTAVELSKKIAKRGRLLSDHNSTAFPYLSATKAPEPNLITSDLESPFSTLARNSRAQYVLSGIYRDISLRNSFWGNSSRRIEIEVFLHDGVNGEVLARRSFLREVSGSVTISNNPAFGSAEFYAGDFGRPWGEMLEEIASWAEAQAACLPFIARVIKVAGDQVHIDGGAESGLSNGDTLTVHSWKETSVKNAVGLVLGREKSARSSASLRVVYPRFSVIQIADAPATFEIKPGDILYAQ